MSHLRTTVTVIPYWSPRGGLLHMPTTQAAQAIDLGGVEFGFKNKNRFNIPDEDNPDGLRSPRPLAYRVEFTDPPTTVPFPREFEVSVLARVGLTWLGSRAELLEGRTVKVFALRSQ